MAEYTLFIQSPKDQEGNHIQTYSVYDASLSPVSVVEWRDKLEYEEGRICWIQKFLIHKKKINKIQFLRKEP